MLKKPSGSIIVLTGPSGAGKTTLAHALIRCDNQIHLSISCTSRHPREGEIPGKNYHFISLSEFQNRILQGRFIEYAKIYGNYYGTPKDWILEHQKKSSGDILLEIDYQGLRQVKKHFPKAVSILILPVNFSQLSARLKNRKTESEINLQHRLNAAKKEIRALSNCHYMVFNENIDQATSDLTTIIQAQRLRLEHHKSSLLADYQKQ